MTKINSTGSHNISWSKKSYLRIFPIEVIHRANIIQTSAPHHHPIILEECWLPLLLLVRLPLRLPAAWSYHQQLGDDPTVIGTTCLLDLAGSLKLHTKKTTIRMWLTLIVRINSCPPPQFTRRTSCSNDLLVSSAHIADIMLKPQNQVVSTQRPKTRPSNSQCWELAALVLLVLSREWGNNP